MPIEPETTMNTTLESAIKKLTSRAIETLSPDEAMKFAQAALNLAHAAATFHTMGKKD